jgi:hypothetical protein
MPVPGHELGGAVALPDGRVVVLVPDVFRAECNSDDDATLEVEVLSADAATWSLGPSIRSRVGMGVATGTSGTIYLFGGSDRTIDGRCGQSVTPPLDHVQTLTLGS